MGTRWFRIISFDIPWTELPCPVCISSRIALHALRAMGEEWREMWAESAPLCCLFASLIR